MGTASTYWTKAAALQYLSIRNKARKLAPTFDLRFRHAMHAPKVTALLDCRVIGGLPCGLAGGWLHECCFASAGLSLCNLVMTMLKEMNRGWRWEEESRGCSQVAAKISSSCRNTFATSHHPWFQVHRGGLQATCEQPNRRFHSQNWLWITHLLMNTSNRLQNIDAFSFRSPKTSFDLRMTRMAVIQLPRDIKPTALYI